MNYRNCIPVKRFNIGDKVSLDGMGNHFRIIIKVLKTGYKYLSNDVLYSSASSYDPYMIWWSK